MRKLLLLLVLLAAPALANQLVIGALTFGGGPPAGNICDNSTVDCTAWYDASNASSITSSGGLVSQWNDLSASGRHATASTDARKPTTGAATLNGKNVLTWDANDVLLLSSAIPSGTDYTVFVVAKATSFTATRYLFSGQSNGSFQLRAQITTGQAAVVRKAQASILTTTSTLTADTYYIIAVKALSSGTQVWFNGTSAGSNATNPAFTAGIDLLGASTTPGGEGLLGATAFYIFFPGNLTSAEMNFVGNSLETEWAITWNDL